MKPINKLLNEYGESHQNSTNKLIHWICVPAIFFSIVGLLYCIKLPLSIYSIPLNIATIVLIFAILYYFKLSISLSIGMLFFALACLYLCQIIEENSTIELWKISISIFVLAWMGQFYGHKIEGKKPSFLKDLQFLLIGPAWLLSFIYKKTNIRI